jgi:hypothetical protein
MTHEEAANAIGEALKCLGVPEPSHDVAVWLDGDDFRRVKINTGAAVEAHPLTHHGKRYDWMRIGGVPFVDSWSVRPKVAAA